MPGTRSIGVLFSDEANSGLTHDFFAAILEAFKRAVEARDYHLCFINASKKNEKRKTYLEQVREEGYDGVLILCIPFDDPEVVELMESGIPVVNIDEEVDGVISVKSDNEGGMKALMRYILGMNHKRIAYITGEDCHVTQARLKIYMDMLREAGIEIQSDYIRQGRFRDTNTAAYLTEYLLRLDDIPTCIIYPDDYAAIGGINVLRARGMEIPGDISVAGYDGINVMSIYEPCITTVVQDKQEIGRRAGERLLEWIENPAYELENTIIIDTSLQKGRSVGKVYY